MNTQELNATVTQLSATVEALTRDLASAVADAVALKARVDALEGASAQKRDRGPAGEREMTEEDAFRIKFGDMKGLSHKAAAEALKLSYGQVYSCRGGYTFKKVNSSWTKPAQPQPAQPQEALPQS